MNLVGDGPLAVDVSFVLDADFGGLYHLLFAVVKLIQLGLEDGDVWGDIFNGNLRTAD